MDLAAKFLEEEVFVDQFLEKSRTRLHSGRALTENLLKEFDIDYHEKGQEFSQYPLRTVTNKE